jgi:hypothetical protein
MGRSASCGYLESPGTFSPVSPVAAAALVEEVPPIQPRGLPDELGAAGALPAVMEALSRMNGRSNRR